MVKEQDREQAGQDDLGEEYRAGGARDEQRDPGTGRREGGRATQPVAQRRNVAATRPITRKRMIAAKMTSTVYTSALSSATFMRRGRPRYSR